MEFAGSMLIQIGIFTILATSFNLIIGYGGLMSIAHPIFFALGAYGSGLLNQASGASRLCGHRVRHRAGDDGLDRSRRCSLCASRETIWSSPASASSWGCCRSSRTRIGRAVWAGAQQHIAIDLGGRASSDMEIRRTGRHRRAARRSSPVRWLVSGEYGSAITAMRDDEEAFKGLGHDAVGIKLVLFANRVWRRHRGAERRGDGQPADARAGAARDLAQLAAQRLFPSLTVLDNLLLAERRHRGGPWLGAYSRGYVRGAAQTRERAMVQLEKVRMTRGAPDADRAVLRQAEADQPRRV